MKLDSSGNIVVRLVLNTKDFDASFAKSQKAAQAEAKRTAATTQASSKQTAATVQTASRKTADVSKKSAAAVEKGWWSTFGKVALGFTIAYRAMNVFETGIRTLVASFGEAIRESGELASYQAKLAMFYKLSTGSTEKFGAIYERAAVNTRALGEESVKALSSLSDLSTGFDELAQAGIIVTKKTTPMFASMVGFTKLVAQTTGSSMRQVRQEFQALTEGQVRTTNILVRSMKRFGVLTKEDLSNLKAMINTQAIIEKVASRIHDEWKNITELILTSDPIMALEYFQKSMRAIFRESITLASSLTDVNNIFAEILYKHAEGFRGLFDAKDMAKFTLIVLDLGKAFDWALTQLEKLLDVILWLGTTLHGFIVYVRDAFTNITVLSEGVSILAKTFGTLAIIVVVEKMIISLGKAMLWLVATPFKMLFTAIKTLRLYFLAIPMLIGAVIVAFYSLWQTWQDTIPEITNSIKAFVTDMLPGWMQEIWGFIKWLGSKVAEGATWAIEKVGKLLGITKDDVKSFFSFMEGFGKSAANVTKVAAGHFIENVKLMLSKFKEWVAPIVAWLDKELGKIIEPEALTNIMAKLKDEIDKVGVAGGLAGGKLTGAIEDTKKKVSHLHRALRLELQLLKEIGLARREYIERSAKFELDLRKSMIKELEIEEDKKLLLLELANKAYAKEIAIIYGSLYDGLIEGSKEFGNELKFAFEIGAEMSLKAGRAMKSAFSDTFFAYIKNDVSSLQDMWMSFTDNMTRMFTDALAEMVMQWTIAQMKMLPMKLMGEEAGPKFLGGSKFLGGIGSVIGGLFGGGQTGITPGAYGDFAKGGAFTDGKLTALASGGVIKSPILFPMANGMGLAGEAGDEGILPLARMASGDLGVKASGSSGSGVVIKGPLMQVNTPDVGGFRKSKDQITGDMLAILNRVQKRNT